jgi:hypothetical protein
MITRIINGEEVRMDPGAVIGPEMIDLPPFEMEGAAPDPIKILLDANFYLMLDNRAWFNRSVKDAMGILTSLACSLIAEQRNAGKVSA